MRSVGIADSNDPIPHIVIPAQAGIQYSQRFQVFTGAMHMALTKRS
jgi:hypothetical protein